MPSIASRLTNDIPTLVASTPQATAPSMGPSAGLWGSQPAPIVSTILRCPLPSILTNPNPDNLRQFYAGGSIPQYRFNPPNSINK